MFTQGQFLDTSFFRQGLNYLIVDDLSSTAFEDASSTPPDDGGIFDERGVTTLFSDKASTILIVDDSISTNLCAEDSIGHDDSIKVKRLDKPKVKDDSLTPLSSDEASTVNNSPCPDLSWEDLTLRSI